MIANIIDKRTNKYDVRCDVAFEPSWHDNTIKGATQFWRTRSFSYDEKRNTTIVQAIEFAQKWDEAVTMFVYDLDFLAREGLK
jgi:hypothetical protein